LIEEEIFMPLFVIALLVFAVAIAVVLLARLVTSYPLGFAGLVCVVGAAVLAFVDDKTMLGIVWLVFSVAAAVAGALNLYKNLRGAFWWSLGAVLGLILGAVPWGELLEDAEKAQKRLEALQELIESEHSKILTFVTETLRSNTIADTTIELPQYTVPSLTDIVPDYNSTEQSYHPPVARAPPAPITTTSHRSQPSSGSADDGSIPPPSRPPPQHPVSP